MEALWTIDELSSRVSDVLATGYAGAPNGRVRAVPDERTIRYYATLGLLDRPAEMRGRTAFYGRRHLLQLVAIKRLQAEGHKLAEIQRRIAGLPTKSLERLAQVPEATEEKKPERPAARARTAPKKKKREQAFWAAAPAGVSSEAPQPPAPAPVRALQAVTLAPGVTLLIDESEPLGSKRVAAVRRAAGPLLELLADGTRGEL